MVTKFNAEQWLETTVRGIETYTKEAFDPTVYEVIMEFPGPELDSRKAPWEKTIVHFDIDAQDDFPLGMGDKPHLENYDEDIQGIFPQYGAMHVLNFDVGVWATDRSGGVTSRMRVKQHLWNLFGIPHGLMKLREATKLDDGGIEITSFSGGHNTIDSTTNDIRMYRMVDCSLEVRVFSRTPLPDESAPTIETIVQQPGLTIIG